MKSHKVKGTNTQAPLPQKGLTQNELKDKYPQTEEDQNSKLTPFEFYIAESYSKVLKEKEQESKSKSSKKYNLNSKGLGSISTSSANLTKHSSINVKSHSTTNLGSKKYTGFKTPATLSNSNLMNTVQQASASKKRKNEFNNPKLIDSLRAPIIQSSVTYQHPILTDTDRDQPNYNNNTPAEQRKSNKTYKTVSRNSSQKGIPLNMNPEKGVIKSTQYTNPTYPTLQSPTSSEPLGMLPEINLSSKNINRKKLLGQGKSSLQGSPKHKMIIRDIDKYGDVDDDEIIDVDMSEDKAQQSQFTEDLNQSYLREQKKQQIANKLKSFRQYKTSEPNPKSQNDSIEIAASPTMKNRSYGENGGLINMIDKLVIDGQLEIEAVNYFHPEQLGKKTKRSEAEGSPSNLQSVKKLDKRKSNYFYLRKDNNINLELQRPISDVIPNWLQKNTQFYDRYRDGQSKARIPVFITAEKEPSERDKFDLEFIAQWLESLNIFSQYNYDILVQFASRLKTLYLSHHQILCHEGDPASSLFIIYKGQVEILVDHGTLSKGFLKEGQSAGRQSLDTTLVRTATLRAYKEAFVIILNAADFQDITRKEIDITASRQQVHDFIQAHDFFKNLNEQRLRLFLTKVDFRKYYKNEVVYDFKYNSNRFYCLMTGKVVREVEIRIEKSNKWPTSMKGWRKETQTRVYMVTLDIEGGDLFGTSDMINNAQRSEKVIVLEESIIFSLDRQVFLNIFDESDIFKFRKKAEEDDRKKAEKVKRIFEDQAQLEKSKKEAVTQAFYRNQIEKRGGLMLRDKDTKMLEWNKFEKDLIKSRSQNQKLTNVITSVKDTTDIYS